MAEKQIELNLNDPVEVVEEAKTTDVAVAESTSVMANPYTDKQALDHSPITV